jgi:predicted NBD/HSP70 family sugar kinase
MGKRILVLDVGGSHVKVHVTGQAETVKLSSGRALTPRRMLASVGRAVAAKGWQFDAVSIGIPAPVVRGEVVREPANLGRGWSGFDFSGAMGKPVQLVNDAAMQALGSYRKGTMLFLGLGTGLGSALVVDGLLVPMELARLPYRKGELEDHVGERALLRVGKRRWRRRVADVVQAVTAAFVVDEVVLGGGNARHLKDLPEGVRLGSNALAIAGGERLWQMPGSTQRRGARGQARAPAHGHPARSHGRAQASRRRSPGQR